MFPNGFLKNVIFMGEFKYEHNSLLYSSILKKRKMAFLSLVLSLCLLLNKDLLFKAKVDRFIKLFD